MSPEEVERFTALGTYGWERFRAGEPDKAAAAFRSQVTIHASNPEPWVSLALLAAARGDEDAAIESIRAAVMRGFTDLGRVERAEAWVNLTGHRQFLYLQDVIPQLQRVEDAWAGWDAYEAARAPKSVREALDARETRHVALELMQPALGERATRLWNRLNDRVAAALLEAYVDERADAPDRPQAVEALFDLYAGGHLLRWERLPQSAARRLGAVADVALASGSSTVDRAGALTCLALARFAERDRDGRLAAANADAIRVALDDVLESHPRSPFIATAAEGLVRTEAEAGRPERAAAAYRAFRAAHGGDEPLLREVRDRLGELALVAGGLPEFSATALDGASVQRDALLGSVVVVDFWATWCGPCVEEIPTLRRIDEKYGNAVRLVGVNLDHAESLTPEALAQWIGERGLPGVQLHDGEGWESALVDSFGVREIPFSVVVDAAGEVLAVGAHGKQLEKVVRQAVREN